MQYAAQTIFNREADIEQNVVSDVTTRNLKTNGFRKRGAEFRTMVNFEKDNCIEE
jgi:hypothetical protein